MDFSSLSPWQPLSFSLLKFSFGLKIGFKKLAHSHNSPEIMVLNANNMSNISNGRFLLIVISESKFA